MSITFRGIITMQGRNTAPIKPLVTAHPLDPVIPPEATNTDLLTGAWEARSAAPGSQSERTVNIDGHACAAWPCVFNNLHRLAVGDLVQLRTPHGVLTYRVIKKPFTLTKDARFAGDQRSQLYNREIAAQVPGQLDLFTCGYVGDTHDSPYIWVVIAHLVAVQQR